MIFSRYKDPSETQRLFASSTGPKFGAALFRKTIWGWIIGGMPGPNPGEAEKEKIATIMFPLIWNWSFSNLAWQRNKNHVRQSAESTLTCLEGKVDELLKSMANLQQEMTMIKGFLANSRSTPPMIASATASKNQHSSCQKASFVFNRTLLSLLLTWEWRRCCYILGEV